jgi:phage shock protein E
MATVVIITLILSTVFLFYRFGNRSIRFGANQAAITAIQKIQNGAVIIDVRTEGEFQSGHYPGSKNIPVNMVAARMSEIPKGRPIVVYCSAGGRSASARDILIRHGYSDVINAGGLNDLYRAKSASEEYAGKE